MEVLIVLVIVGVIASIALPNYQQSVIKTRRADAATSLMALAQRLERCHTQFGRYNDTGCAVPDTLTSESGFYALSVTRTASQFSLEAVPSGSQQRDGDCTKLVVNNLGQRSATGAAPETCW